MYSISFRANPTNNIASQIKKNNLDTKLLKSRFSEVVQNIKTTNQGKPIQLNKFVEAFNDLCNEFGAKASEYYNIFLECMRTK